MKKSTIWLKLYTMVFAVMISACTDSKESKPIINISKNTKISAILEQQITLNDNLLYCASFQKAWDSMHDKIIKSDIVLKNDSFISNELNRQLIDKNDISSGSYVAVAGELSNQLIDELTKELRSKFGELSQSEFNIPRPTSNSHQLFAYAFLYKNIKFRYEFERLHEPINFMTNNNISKVASFGIDLFSSSNREHLNLSQQVEIFDYINDDDFIIKLTTGQDADEIILAKIAPEKTIMKTYKQVIGRVSRGTASALKDNETLRIPIINFDLSQDISELKNTQITNKGWNGWIIANAVMNIRFKLDEKGAVLKSFGSLSAKLDEPEKPRNFIFNKPYFVCLKQKGGKLPYLAMWFNNSELFHKAP